MNTLRRVMRYGAAWGKRVIKVQTMRQKKQEKNSVTLRNQISRLYSKEKWKSAKVLMRTCANSKIATQRNMRTTRCPMIFLKPCSVSTSKNLRKPRRDSKKKRNNGKANLRQRYWGKLSAENYTSIPSL